MVISILQMALIFGRENVQSAKGVKHKEIKFLVAYKYVMCYNNFVNVLMCITNKCIMIHI